jgi:AcrR family transcriptional regulator
MPKITEEHREYRRGQILKAAWRCFQRNGVQATTMEQIIQESGLSASAMYRYFAGQEDIVRTAIVTSLGDLSRVLEPLVESNDALAPHLFVERVMNAIAEFSRRDDFNLMSIAIHGWSQAQHNEELHLLMRDFYTAFRERVGAKAVRWKRAGLLGAQVRAEEVAQAVLAAILGYVVQATLLPDTRSAAIARGLAAL